MGRFNKEEFGMRIKEARKNKGLSTENLAMMLKNATYLNDFGAICRFLKERASDGDLILFMGAGDINQAGKNLANI